MNNLFGKYRAEVIDINDPEKMGRIKVLCPSVMKETPLEWAMSCFPPGVFIMPNVGDFVWIEFEEGKIDKPIWTGIFPTKKYVNEKFFKEIPYNPELKMLITEGNEDIILYVKDSSIFRMSSAWTVWKAPVSNWQPPGTAKDYLKE